MSTCNLTTTINYKQCLSESRRSINTNFENIDTALCAASASFIGVTGGVVSKIVPGNGISIQPATSNGTGNVTINIDTCPQWCVGATNKILYNELVVNRTSKQYTEFNMLIKHVSDITEQNIPLPGSESLITLPYNFGTQFDKYCASTLLTDGRVFLGPNTLTTATIYDIKTNTAFTPPIPTGIGYPGVSNAFSNTLLLPDGKLYHTPYDTIYARTYTPGNNNLNTELSAGTFTTSKGFSKSILLPNGNIYHVPYNSIVDRVYNISTGTTTVSPNIYPGTLGSFTDGVLLPNSNIFLVPYRHTSAALFNFTTNTLNYIFTYNFGTGGGGFSGGVLLADGRVFCVPTNTSKAVIYDSITGQFTVASGTYPLGNSSCGGVLLADGRVLITPQNGNTIKIYDPRQDSLHDTGLILGSGISHSNGILLKNGDVFFAPRSNTHAKYLKYFHQSNFSTSYLTGLFS